MINPEDKSSSDLDKDPPDEPAPPPVDTTASETGVSNAPEPALTMDESADGNGAVAAPIAPEPTPEESQGLRRVASGQRAKKIDRDTVPKALDVPVEGVRKARAVFVPPINYLQQVDSFNSQQHIWVVTGRPQSGKFTCALHLGLTLLRQGRPMNRGLYQTTSSSNGSDHPEDYARGIRMIRQRLEQRRNASESMLEEEVIVELATLEARLRDNLSYTDNENRRSDRYEVLAQLNGRSLDLFSMSFHDLCRWTDVQGNAPDDTTLLQALPSVKVLRRDGRGGLTLQDLLQDQNLERQTVYIMERAFESGVSQGELSPLLQAGLSSNESYLILTTELTEQALGQVGVPRISTRFGGSDKDQNLFLHAVLRAHLDYYAAVDGLSESLCVQVEQVQDHILQHALRQPFTIDMFCARLRGLPVDADRDVVNTFADQVGRIDREATRTWFRALPENERLYALLTYLFDGVERYLLDNLYTLSVLYLRQDGVGGLRDPREVGLDDIRDRIRAHATESNTVQFNNPALVEEVRRQVANYHHILWSLCEHVFGPLIGEYRAMIFAPFRQSLGTAIGRLGMYHEVKLEPLLDELAAHDSGGVASTAGYILDGLVRANPALCIWVGEWIAGWARSQDPDRMWAASAALWRVYDGVSEIIRGDHAVAHGRLARETLIQLRDILTELATHPDRFHEAVHVAARARAEAAAREEVPDMPETDALARAQVVMKRRQRQQELLAAQTQEWIASQVDSIIYALFQMSRQYIADVVNLVTLWLQEPSSSNLHVVGELAVQRLIGDTVEHSGARPMRLIVERHEPLLALVGPMLGADEEAVRSIFLTLRQWIHQDGWDTRVHRALLQTIARASFAERSLLAVSIAEEWDDNTPVVSAIAQSLITRARLLNGLPVDVYHGDPSLILCDSTLPARRQGGIGAHLTRLVAREIAAVAPVITGSLGLILLHPHDDDSPARSGVSLAPTLAPRLMAPVLEALAGPETPLAFVITWGPVLDLEDVCSSQWTDRLLIGALGSVSDIPDGVLRVDVTTRANLRWKANQLIGAALLQMVWRLAKRDAADWWTRVGLLLHQETPDLLAIDAQLDLWIAELDRPSERADADPLRAIMATVSWLAAADLPACVERLVRWLGDPDERQQLAGGAASRALFYLVGSADPAPPVERFGELLRLIGPLTSQGWASTQAILFAVRRWSRTQTWVERMLSPPDGSHAELLQLVGDLNATDQHLLANLLETWAIPLAGDDPESTPARIAQMREQMALRVALGSGRALPALATGQAYGILVVDTSISRRSIRRSLAQVASTALRQLRKRYGSALQVLVFRLGQIAPLAGPTEQPTPDVIAPRDGGMPPRLLGPLLERMPLDQVQFVVLLSSTRVSDEEDWHETPWAARIHVYSEASRVTQPFSAIPSQQTMREGGDAIVEYLTLRYPRS